jgi:hypothetical protein
MMINTLKQMLKTSMKLSKELMVFSLPVLSLVDAILHAEFVLVLLVLELL